jgi:hypothetical protein
MRGPIFAGFLGCALVACGPGPSGGDDTGGNDGGGDTPDAGDIVDPPGNAAVYAHSSSTLYRVDPVTFEVTEVGPFGWPSGSDTMTDIAIDKDGLMIGVSYTSVYRVDPVDAGCTLLSNNLQGMFNGLSFVPAGQVGMPEGADVLVGSRNTDGVIHSIDPMTGAVTPVGDMGGDWVSSGDIVSIHGFGTVATVTTVGALGPDVLARLEVGTFAATPIGSGTGYNDLWGIGFWAGDVFGFSEDGSFVLIDTTTGAATPVETSVPRWWGAAVTTSAPIVD